MPQTQRERSLFRMRKKNERGISLLTVAVMGSVATLWIVSLAAALMPTYQKASQMRYYTIVRSSAEAGLDYSVDELNRAMAAGQVSAIDDTTYDAAPPYSPKVTTLPASAIGNTQASVTIRVYNVPAPTTSAVYMPQVVPTNPAANGWRLVEASATFGGLTKTIRVILSPQVATGTGNSTPVPYFNYAMFGRTYVSMSGNSSTDGFDSRLGAYTASPSTDNRDPLAGNVGSNTLVDLSANAVVGGDLDVFSDPAYPTAIVATRGSNVIVNDEVHLNGTGSSSNPFVGNGPLLLPVDNVLGGSMVPRPVVYDAYQPQLNLPDIDYPAAPAAPPTAYNVGSIQISGNGRIIIDPTAPAPTGAINASGNQTIRIPPGDYKLGNFKTAGNGNIEILSSVTTPTRIFVEGIVPGTNAIQVTGNGVINRTQIPSNLQFWYNGSRGIMLAGNGSLYSTVYAPNATISISGNGAFYGGMVANRVTNSGNGMVHFDKALMDGATSGLTYIPGGTSVTFTHLKTISWQEL